MVGNVTQFLGFFEPEEGVGELNAKVDHMSLGFEFGIPEMDLDMFEIVLRESRVGVGKEEELGCLRVGSDFHCFF